MAALAALTFCLPVLAGFGGAAFAEEETAAPADLHFAEEISKGASYSAVLYDQTNGLPTSEANAIVRTEEGFIWIGSYSGLIRYDGRSFVRYDSSSGIANVRCMFVDSQNRLWVGTNDSGAGVMIHGEFHMFDKHSGLSSLAVHSITEAEDGTVYLGTTGGLAAVDGSLNLKMLEEPQLNGEFVRVLRTGGKTVYGVTKEGAVFTVENGKLSGWYSADKLGLQNIHTLLPDPNRAGAVYLGSTGSMLYYGTLTDNFHIEKKKSIAPCSNINEIHLIGETLWLCTDTGIGFFSDGEFIPVSNIPMVTSIEQMILDYQNNLWFASSKQGIMKIVPNQFTDLFARYQNLEREVVYSTCLHDNQLFVGTKNSGLIVLDLKFDRLVKNLPLSSAKTASGTVCNDHDLITMLKGTRIRSIIRDSQNRLWISTYGDHALVRYENGKVMKFTAADGLPSNRVRVVHECLDGSFLVACTGGVAIIRNDRISEVYDESDGIVNEEILTVTEGINGEIILGTDGGGVYIISGQNVRHFGTDDGLKSDVVMRIKKDISRDLYWIVLSNSLAYMTADYQFHNIEHFPYSNNFDLYENSRGEMWVMSSNGIYITDAGALMQDEASSSCLFYDSSNGLPCIATSNAYSELTPEGDFYLSGMNGVAKFNIEKPFENAAELRAAVPYLKADGKYIYPDKNGKFTVPSDVQKLTVYPFVFNYSLINPVVAYQLEGFENRSFTLARSELESVSYTNLRGGKYNFRLTIQDPNGHTSKTLTIPIVKKKGFFEKPLVKACALLLIAGVICVLVVIYTSHRTRRLEKRSQEQKQLIREIVEAFSNVIDMKDQYTKGHSARVAEYTVMLAKELGIDEETTETYYCIALLHDIGKIGIPPEVLNKPGKLSDEEFGVIKSHSALGFEALKNISILPDLATGAGAHHERPDGKGYPKGLKGDEIPRVAQIIAVADCFDAMYSNRPYRKRMNFEKVVEIIKGASGTQLMPDVVDAFLRLVEQGKMRAPDDIGGGTTEDIDNIRNGKPAETPAVKQ